jgi:hypothetical protein
MNIPVNVPVDDPYEDTEWYQTPRRKAPTSANMIRNDILRKHGIIPEKPPSPTPVVEEAILEEKRIAHEKRLEDKDLDELAALEDEEDEEFLEQYRCAQFLFWISRADYKPGP